MKSEILRKVKTLVSHAAGAQLTDAAHNGESIDGMIGEEVLHVINAGVITDGTHTPKLQHSHDDGAGSPASWVDAAAGDVIGTATAMESTNDERTFTLAYVGARRWSRLVITTASSSSGGYIDAVAVISALRESALSGAA